MKRIIVILLAAALAAGLGGCGNSGGTDRIDIRGEIAAITLGDDGTARSILIEGSVDADTVYDKAMVRVDRDTVIIGQSGKNILAEDLKTGMKVEAVFEGPVAESYPVQAKARIIRVTG